MDQEYLNDPEVVAVYEAFGQADGPTEASSTDTGALPHDGADQAGPVTGDPSEGQVAAEELPEQQPQESDADYAERLAQLEAREAELAERTRQAEEAQRREFERQQHSARLIATLQNVRDEQTSQQVLAELQETNPELAQTFLANRMRTQQQLQQTAQQVHGMEKGMAAFAHAVQAELDPEQFQRIVQLSQELIDLPTPNAMQHYLQTRRQADSAALAEVQQLKQLVQQLQAQQQGQARDPMADAVEAAPAGPGTRQRAEDADTYDDYFSRLIAETPWLQAG